MSSPELAQKAQSGMLLLVLFGIILIILIHGIIMH